MDPLSEKLSGVIFKRDISQDMGEISIDADMLKVLAEVDGIRDVAAIAKNTGLSIIQLRKVLKQLYQHKLILRVKAEIPRADKSFFDFLETNLADVMGPMARVIIDDVVKEMGENRGFFPINRCEDLVKKIAAKLFVEDKKQVFLHVMEKKIEHLEG
jgi:hypothetical protein